MPAHDPKSPSDHLLRTLAAVPVSSQILDLGCGRGRHTEPLLRLGFPVHACDPRPEAVESTRARVEELIGAESASTSVQVTALDALDYPEGTFDWIVADRAEIYVSDEEALRTFLAASRRLLTPGGWLYLTLPAARPPEVRNGRSGADAGFAVETIEEQRRAANLAEASEPTWVDDEEDAARIRALYRRVDPQTPV